MDKIARLVSNIKSRMDRFVQKARIAEEMPETPPPAVTSHRGEGAFSSALAARTSPPGSVTLTAPPQASAPPLQDSAEGATPHLADGVPLWIDNEDRNL